MNRPCKYYVYEYTLYVDLSDSLVVNYQFSGTGLSSDWICCYYSGKCVVALLRPFLDASPDCLSVSTVQKPVIIKD